MTHPDARNVTATPSAKRLGTHGLSALVACFLVGCGTWDTVSKLWTLTSQTETVTLAAAGDVNRGFPVAVDIVAVDDPDFVPVLAETPAETWFLQRGTLMDNNADILELFSFEVVPGQRIEDIDFGWGDRRSVHEIFVFANYVTPGPHRGRLGAFEEPVVILGPETLAVQATD